MSQPHKRDYPDPKWMTFKISANGNMLFSNGRSLGNTAQLACTLCAKPVIGTPLVRLDFVFRQQRVYGGVSKN
jgi:hypothetical protein